MPTAWSQFWSARQGNVAIMAAVFAPVVVIGTALAMDYSALVKQRRSEQTNVDLAAIAGAVDPYNAEVLVARFFSDNNINSAVRSSNGFLMPDGSRMSQFDFDAKPRVDCVATVRSGNYQADPTLDPGKRFSASQQDLNAIQVTQTCKGQLYFGASIVNRPDITVTGTASSRNLASYWVGSRLVSLDGGILNAVLSGLTGSSISLSVMDYNALLGANADIIPTMKALATRLHLQAASYDDVLDAKINFGQFLGAIRAGGNISAAAQAGLASLEASLSKNSRTFSLRQIIDISALGPQRIGSGYTGDARANAYELVRAAATVSNGTSQSTVDLNLNVPGLAAIALKIAIGEPPAKATSIAVNQPGSLVRTAQTRLYLNVKLGGLLSLAGIAVNLPVYLELANGEAQLTAVECRASRPSSVKIAAVPGVSSVAVGNVDPSAFINFKSSPRVMPATLVQALAVKIDGSSEVDMNNTYTSMLDFSGDDIDFGRIKSASVRTPISSVTGSLVNNLNLSISLAGINIGGTAALYKTAMKDTLTVAAGPLDTVLTSVLAALGVKIGAIDLGVTGASCGAPVLVL